MVTMKPKSSKPCKYCGGLDHYPLTCFKRPSKPLKAKKRIKAIGKIGTKWIATRKDWIANNPEPWHCAYCGIPLAIEQLTLDHIKSRSRHPELRFDLSNLTPACWTCNERKGSGDPK